jgi:large subunit ribosomal protein L15
MNLNEVHRGVTKNRRRKRVGRGIGSGNGKTAGRGYKGARSRSGYSRKPTFQGGAMPLVRRVPKRGFHNKFGLTVAAVNVEDLENVFDADAEVTPESLRAAGLLKSRYDELKVLGDGNLTKKLRVSAHRFSKSAEEKIRGAGGEVIVLAGRTPVESKKESKKQGEKAAKPAKK